MPASEQPPLRPGLVTVFYPGFGASRAQAAKYVGEEGVTVLERQSPADPEAPQPIVEETGLNGVSEEAKRVSTVAAIAAARTGNRVLYRATRPGAPRLLHNVFPLPEVPELHRGFSPWPHHWITMLASNASLNILGIQGAPTQHLAISGIDLAGVHDQRECVDSIRKACMRIEEQYQLALRSDPNARRKKLVLFGTSRGAATIFSAALTLDADLASYVALVIVEAPFDSVESVLRASSWTPRLQLTLLSKLTQYQGEHHATPDRVVAAIGTSCIRCPFAFITSERDRRVPSHLTDRLMALLRQHHPAVPVRHLHLQHSHHSAMSLNHAEDRAAYLRFLNRLYDECEEATQCTAA